MTYITSEVASIKLRENDLIPPDSRLKQFFMKLGAKKVVGYQVIINADIIMAICNIQKYYKAMGIFVPKYRASKLIKIVVNDDKDVYKFFSNKCREDFLKSKYTILEALSSRDDKMYKIGEI